MCVCVFFSKEIMKHQLNKEVFYFTKEEKKKKKKTIFSLYEIKATFQGTEASQNEYF